MTNLCGTAIPPSIMSDLERIQHDDSAVKDYGVELSVKMIKELWQEGVRGYHLCTLNLEKSITRVLEGLGWVENEGERRKANLQSRVTHSLSRSSYPNSGTDEER